MGTRPRSYKWRCGRILTDLAKKLQVEIKGKLKWRFEPSGAVLSPSARAGQAARVASSVPRRGLSCLGRGATRARHWTFLLAPPELSLLAFESNTCLYQFWSWL